MPVILLIAYMIKKITNRKTIKEWDEEDESDQNAIPENDFTEPVDNNDLLPKSG